MKNVLVSLSLMAAVLLSMSLSALAATTKSAEAGKYAHHTIKKPKQERIVRHSSRQVRMMPEKNEYRTYKKHKKHKKQAM